MATAGIPTIDTGYRDSLLPPTSGVGVQTQHHLYLQDAVQPVRCPVVLLDTTLANYKNSYVRDCITRKELFVMAPDNRETLYVCMKCSTQSEYVVHNGDC